MMTDKWKSIVTNIVGFNESTDIIISAIERYLKFDTSLTIRADIDANFDDELIEKLTDKAEKYYQENQELLNKTYKKYPGMKGEIVRAHLADYNPDIKKFDTEKYREWRENMLRDGNINEKVSPQGLYSEEFDEIIRDVTHGHMKATSSILNDEKQFYIDIKIGFIDAIDESHLRKSLSSYLFTHHSEHFHNANIVKSTCQELGLTYKQLGEAIGYGDGAIKNASSSGKISEPMQKAIQLYKKTLELEAELENSNQIKSTLKEWLK